MGGSTDSAVGLQDAGLLKAMLCTVRLIVMVLTRCRPRHRELRSEYADFSRLAAPRAGSRALMKPATAQVGRGAESLSIGGDLSVDGQSTLRRVLP